MKFNDLVKLCESDDSFRKLGDDSDDIEGAGYETYSNLTPRKLLLHQWEPKFEDVYIDYNWKAHREGGPAVVKYYKSLDKKVKETEEWFKHGKPHRLDGPAYIEFYTDGNKVFLYQWYKDGLRHRLDGPAYIMDPDSPGNRSEQYWINGSRLPKEEFDSITKNVDKENIDDVTGLSDLF